MTEQQSGGIRHNDRALILADTGAGKSELLNFLWEQYRTQRLMLDSKDEFSIPDLAAKAAMERERGRPVAMEEVPNIKPTRNAEDLHVALRTQGAIHYIPSHEGKAGIAEMNDLFREAYNSPHPVIVFAHEISDVCQYQPSRTPDAFNGFVSKGRVRGKGLFAGSQLPVHMPVRAKTLNQHVIVGVPRFIRSDDMAEIAKMVGQPEKDFAAQLDAMHDELGDYSFVHFDRRTRQLIANVPLNEQARGRITIIRRDDA